MNYKKKIRYYFIVIFLGTCICLPDYSYAQLFRVNKPYENIGVYSKYDYNFYKASFSKLPGVPKCCEGFSSSSGNGFSLGGVYDYFFSSYGFQMQVGFDSHTGNFHSIQNEILGIEGTPAEGQFEHHIDFSIQNINLQGALTYNITDKINMSVGIGAFYYYSSHYSQYEKIIKPANKATFLDADGNDTHSFIRNSFSGTLPNINKIQTYATAKIGYELPVKKDRSVFLRPEIGIDYSFSKMIKQLNWKLISLKFGLSLILTSASYEKIKIEEDEAMLVKKLEIQKSENDSLKREKDRELINRKFLEEKLKKDSIEKSLIAAELAEKLRIEKDNKEKELIEKTRIEQERLDMSRMIDEENDKAGKKCSCFVILFSSTTDKNQADKLLRNLKNSGVNNAAISIFIEPYLKQKYYRVKSNCYSDHNNAFDDRIKYLEITGKLDIVPQIICDK